MPGRRTVTAILRILGLSGEVHFQNYHRVLNRAVWSSLALSRVLLQMLLDTFVPKGPIVLGLDDTIERRRGAHIRAKGIYRDPVRSSQSHFVKASGLCWLSLMLLGAAFPDNTVSLGTLLPESGQGAQDLDRVGGMDAAAGPALAAWTFAGRGCG